MVLVFADQLNSEIKKSTYEALSYGAAIAQQLGVSSEAIVLGTVKADLSTLGNYGITKVHHLNNENRNN